MTPSTALNTAFEQWKYVPVRRMALFIEQSLLNSLGWAVFEPNDEPLWIALMQGAPLAERSYNHVAFKVEEADFEARCARLTALGVEVLAGRPRVEGEARSLYFHDFDNHLFELQTRTLDERLARYAHPA